MKQLIYRSRPFGFDNSTLAGILMQARRKNRDNDITGALICRRDLYLQLLEGPNEAVDSVYKRIQDDDRHIEVRLEATAVVQERIFPEWSMLDDTEPSMIFSKSEVEDGAIDRATPEILREMFLRIATSTRETTGEG